MHQFVSVNRTSYDGIDEFRCLRYNLDDVAYGKASENIDICPKDACLPELPPTNPSWRTCKRKWSYESKGVCGPVRGGKIISESKCMILRKMEFIWSNNY